MRRKPLRRAASTAVSLKAWIARKEVQGRDTNHRLVQRAWIAQVARDELDRLAKGAPGLFHVAHQRADRRPRLDQLADEPLSQLAGRARDKDVSHRAAPSGGLVAQVEAGSGPVARCACGRSSRGTWWPG
jgi:hypothetical protein